jgi:two-component system cell cycle sensor histidine kinase/response regulator CckA
MSEPTPLRVLYVGGNADLGQVVVEKLRESNWTVNIASGLERVFPGGGEVACDAVVVDCGAPAHEGLQTIRRLSSRGAGPPVVAVAEGGQARIAVEAMKLGASDCVVRDAEGEYLELLPAVIERLAEQQQLIEEAQRDEERLRDSEKRYRRITEAVTDYIYTVRIENGHPIETKHGEGCLAVTGYSSQELAVDPHLWIRMVLDEDRDLVREQAERILAGETPEPVEHRIVRKDGATRWIRNTVAPHKDAQGTLLSYDGLIRDITGQKEAEERRRKIEAHLRQAEKMESLNVMAGAIAHNFNNMLMGVLGFLDLALRDLPKGTHARKAVEEAQHAAQRAAELSSLMLVYVGQGLGEMETVDVDRLIEEAREAARPAVSKRIVLQSSRTAESKTIWADLARVRQVLRNLIANAAEAIGENRGAISVRSDAVDLGRKALSETYIDDDLRPGRYVRLEVSDTGSGMDGKTLARIFDPFFTTRFTGRGLGLAVALGIVRAHRGAINVDSAPERGTTVRVFFPAKGGVPWPKRESDSAS